jgi:thiol-disulfide isomerase/thioredoxin
MALTPSTMLSLGTPLPFAAIQAALSSGAAQQVSGDPLDLSELGRRPLLVLFICAHCPFVKHIEPELTRLARDFARTAPPQLDLLAISSNSTRTHPQDGPDGLRAQADAHGWRFPYLLDADQQLARAFRAACTPDLFLFSPARSSSDRSAQLPLLVYRGQLDASRPGNDRPLNGADLRRALAALQAGQPVPAEQQPAIGCNIKWHPGEEPDWAR